VVNECTHVLRRKQQIGPAEVARLLEDIIQVTRVAEVGITQIRQAWGIAERYLYGHFDSLIVASALSAGCSVLYTEDLQHGQVVDGQMTIVDPFRESRADLEPGHVDP
jgi:predicted nucleic acid-binding protein